jgi:hypothetical protein
MKKLLLSASLLISALGAQAQLAPGSIAPDFTVSAYQTWLSTAGMNNNGSYKLYDYLDAGYTVILDVSATWCGPCWNYHLSGAFEDVYAAHGPAGYPGVSANTTDDLMIIWIEGDGTTADATMLDGSGTIGNWTNPNSAGQIMFPMANPATASANTINNDFNIGYFPTIYKICPNRVVSELSQPTAAAIYSSIASCPPVASNPADVACLSFNGVTEICPGDYTPKVTIQNNGTANMTSATVTVQVGGATVSTGTYTGNLATYGVAQVTCSTISGFTGGTLNITVTTASDANAANGTINQAITVNNNPATAATNMIKVDITTDQYGSETTWELTSSAGAIIASGGPWANLTASGQTVRPTVNVNGLMANQCYKFTIYDAYGDGMNGGFGTGSFSVKDVNNTVLLSGGTFTTEESGLIKTGIAGIDETSITLFNVYPNPASDLVNISFEGENTDYSISLMDIQGRVISSREIANASGEQVVSFSTENVAKGSYIVTVTSNGATTTKNVVIK